MSWYEAYKAKAAAPPIQRVNNVKSVSPAHDPENTADDAQIDPEPRLPMLGTPARIALDREHAAMVAGLLKVAKPNVSPARAEH